MNQKFYLKQLFILFLIASSNVVFAGLYTKSGSNFSQFSETKTLLAEKQAGSDADSILDLKSADITSAGATLSWGKVPKVKTYRVTLYKNGAKVKSINTSANSTTVNGLEAGTTYTWNVTGIGSSNKSVTVSFKTRATDDVITDEGPIGLVSIGDGEGGICSGTFTYYRDADGDGFGNPNDTRVDGCTPPPGYISNSQDCNDANPAINPSAPEIIDGIDNNCNGVIDEVNCIVTVRTRNITVNLSTGGNATITPAQINNGSTGTCGPLTFSLSRTFFTCDEVGPNNVTLTVTDANGTTAVGSAIVTVVDNTLPSMSIPQPVVVNAPTSACLATVVLTTPAVLDACGVASVTRNPSGNTFPVGVTSVVWTVTDVNGNTTTSTQTVTVRDVTDPTFTTTPQNITVNAASTCNTVPLTAPTASDNCGVTSITRSPSGNTFCIGTTTVVWTATDASGNTATINQTVTVRDVTPPTFTSTPQNITVNGAPNCNTVTLTPPTATDNVGVVSITSNPVSGSTFCIGTTTVVWTATDASGNTATISQTVTVRDVTPPTFTSTPQNITVNGAPNCNTVPLTPPTATDNVGVVSITSNPVSGSTFCIGTTTVVWTATDASGNTATISQTVTVRDVTPPTVTTPQPINVNGAPCTALITLTPPAATDNVGIASINRNPAGNTFSVGTTNVVWTVTDNSGNTTLVTQQVVVADVTAPTVVTRNITVQLGTNGTVTITDAAVDNGSTDACGPVTLSVSKKTFDCSNIGPNTVTLNVTDSSGNSAQATAVVTVQGTSITYYRDSDGDGFGNPQNNTTVCSNTPPTGFVTNNTDCDDTRSAINPNTVWYKDADNDGYGDGTTQTQCTQPTGFKLASALTATSGDCNDNNAAINPGATEICDGIDNNCNNQTDESGQTTWYLDADSDGFAVSTTVSCSSPGAGYTTTVLPLGDCDDNNAAINPNTVWYEDRDGDGYPSGTTRVSCERPRFFFGGFLSTTFTLGKLASELTSLTTDCDDTNPAVNPGITWFKDADNDGFSDGTSVQSCQRPVGFKLSSELTATAGDCNDNNGAVRPGATEICDGIDNNCNGQIDEGAQRTWYLDADGDGFAVSTTVSCNSPGAGFTTTVLLLGDCNDNNAAINPNTVWYKDTDNDGYSDGTTQTQCAQPTGFKLASELTATSGDCNDNNAAINPGATEICDGIDNNCNDQIDEGVQSTWYLDADGDGFAVSTTVSCNSPGAGYTTTVLPLGDCDDSNAAINPNTVWFKDADNDGYSDGTTQTQCAQPTGFKLASALTATSGDCNDNNAAINPGATEICDGIDNNCNGQIDEGVQSTWYLDADGDGFAVSTTVSCSSPGAGFTNTVLPLGDCNDSNAAINPNTVWYKDADNDGYSDGTTRRQCTQPAGFRLASVLTALSGDCNDNDPAVFRLQTFFRDADGDGFGNAASRISVCRSTPPAGYVATAGDCNDNNASVNPGAIEVCGNRIDDNCNGRVDEAVCLPCSNAFAAATTNITTNSAQLNWLSFVNPVQWQIQYRSTNRGAQWVSVTVSGNLRSLSLRGLSANQEYVWQIRARCGNSWTSYSPLILFRTTGSTVFREKLNVTPEANEPIKTVLNLYPNPSNGTFFIQVDTKEPKQLTAQVRIRDFLGKVVYTEKALLVNGTLRKQMQLPGTLSSGMYLIEVVTDTKTLSTRLNYSKY